MEKIFNQEDVQISVDRKINRLSERLKNNIF